MTINGDLILVEYEGEQLDCQLDATFTAGAEVTTSQPCKGEGKASRQSVSSTNWSITVNGKTQTTASATANAQWQLLDALKLGLPVSVGFVAGPDGLAVGEDAFVIEGNAIVTELTVEAPQDGESTYSATFTGDGDWTKTLTPVTE